MLICSGKHLDVFYFCTKNRGYSGACFCVSARLLWDAGNYDFAIFNMLMIRCLLAAAKPYVAIGDEKLTTKFAEEAVSGFLFCNHIFPGL